MQSLIAPGASTCCSRCERRLNSRSALDTLDPSHPSGTLAPFSSVPIHDRQYLPVARATKAARPYLPDRIPRPTTRVATRRRARILLSSRAAGYFSSTRRWTIDPSYDSLHEAQWTNSCLSVISLISGDVCV